MNLPEFSVRNSIFGNMLTIAVFIAGIFTAVNITRELFPLTDLDIISVATVYRNASPEEVENHVTIPLEEEIRGIDGIEEFISVSSEGISRIVITLDPDEEDNKDAIVAEISRKVDGIKDLPEDVEKPEIEIIQGGNEVIHITISGEELSEKRIRDIALDIKARIESIKGVSRVDKSGWRDPEIWVEINPEKLIENELSLVEVSAAVARQNVNMPGGKIKDGTTETLIRTVGEFKSLEDVENVVVRSNSDGRNLTVGDIGSAKYDYSDDAVIVRAEGSRGIILDVRKKLSGDTIEISDNVEKLVEGIREEYKGEGVEIGILNFESYVIKRRLRVLLSNGLAGLVLVVCVLPFVLNFRLAIVTALGIPFAFLTTILVMAVTGITINMITMFGMILVIGMLVDDAIIVSENVFRHIEMGKSPFQAAIDGSKEVMWPVTATILTTIAAFVPLLFLPGIMGKFLKWIPTIVIITLTASLFEALVILPCHISEFVRHTPKDETIKGGKFWEWLDNRYAALIRKILHHRAIFVGLTIAMLFVSMGIAKKFMYIDLFPSDLIEIFSVNVSTPEGTHRDATEERVAAVENMIQEHLEENELKNLVSYVGYQRDYDAANIQMGTRYGSVFVYLTPPQMRKRTAQKIIADLQCVSSNLTGVSEITYDMVKGGPPVGKAIDIKIVGDDYEKLNSIADRMKESLAQYEGVTDVKDDHDLGKKEMRLNIDRKEAARLGLNVDAIARTVYSGFQGMPATSIRNSEDETIVRVKLAEPYRDQMEQLLKLKVPNNQGRLIAIGKVAKIENSRAASGLYHFNGDRAISVMGDVKNKEKNSKAVASANLGLWDEYKDVGAEHKGYRIARTGEWEDNEEMKIAIMRAAGISILLIYTILVIQFKSFAQPFTVLASIPFGAIGVIIALMLHGKPLSLMAMMGMVGLTGVVVNDAIVLVSFINDLRKDGMPVSEAIPTAAATRLRPIILTSITTVLGLAPVIYGIGGYEPFVAPAAIVLAYGLLFATWLTLLVVPCMYSLGVDIKRAAGCHVE